MTEKRIKTITGSDTMRVEHLKTLIRYSTEAELKLTKEWFIDTSCSEKMTHTKNEIKQAISELEKDAKVKITITKGEKYYTIKMKAE